MTQGGYAMKDRGRPDDDSWGDLNQAPAAPVPQKRQRSTTKPMVVEPVSSTTIAVGKPAEPARPVLRSTKQTLMGAPYTPPTRKDETLVGIGPRTEPVKAPVSRTFKRPPVDAPISSPNTYAIERMPEPAPTEASVRTRLIAWLERFPLTSWLARLLGGHAPD